MMKHSAIATIACPMRTFLMASLLMGTVLMGSIAFFAGALPAFSQEKEKDKDKLPQVLLKTTKGDILLELYEDQAPNTVANFVSLVEKKLYDKLKFHRVKPGYVVKGGEPKEKGTRGRGD